VAMLKRQLAKANTGSGSNTTMEGCPECERRRLASAERVRKHRQKRESNHV
jgi:hypothetical protein